MKPFQPTDTLLNDLGFAFISQARGATTYRRTAAADRPFTREIVLHDSGETQLIDYDYTEKPDYMYEGLVPSEAFFRRLLTSVGWDPKKPHRVGARRPEVKEDAKYRPYGLENKVEPRNGATLNPDYPVTVNVRPNRDGTYKVYQSGHHVADAHYLMLGHTEFARFGRDLRGIGKICLRGGMGTTAERVEQRGRQALGVELIPNGGSSTEMFAPTLTRDGVVVKGGAVVAWTSKGLFSTYTF